MIPPHDVVADLPAPMDDEPPSVRQDIADELADHLACAYRRELLKTADERTAQQRVLDRFGNPQRIAYQLWFQALWGRIMLNRFGRVVQGLKIVGGLLLLFFVFRMAEQQTALHNQLVFLTASNNSMQSQAAGNRMMLEQVLSRLPAAPQLDSSSGMAGIMGANMAEMGGFAGMEGGASGGMIMGIDASNPPQRGLKLRLVIQGDQKEPPSNCLISVLNENGASLMALHTGSPSEGMGAAGGMGMMAGMMPGGMPSGTYGTVNSAGKPAVRLSPEMKGEIYFSKPNAQQAAMPLEPGRYTAQIEFPDGRVGVHRFVVSPGRKAELIEETVECPPVSENAYVTFHTPIVDQPLAAAGIQYRASVSRRPSRLGKSEWSFSKEQRSWMIDFDPQTGAALNYQTSQWLNPPTSTVNVKHEDFDLRELAESDRFLTLPSGTYFISLSVRLPESPSFAGGFAPKPYSESVPATGAAMEGVLTINPDTRDVLLELPSHALEDLKKRFTGPEESQSVKESQGETGQPAGQ